MCGLTAQVIFKGFPGEADWWGAHLFRTMRMFLMVSGMYLGYHRHTMKPTTTTARTTTKQMPMPPPMEVAVDASTAYSLELPHPSEAGSDYRDFLVPLPGAPSLGLMVPFSYVDVDGDGSFTNDDDDLATGDALYGYPDNAFGIGRAKGHERHHRPNEKGSEKDEDTAGCDGHRACQPANHHPNSK